MTPKEVIAEIEAIRDMLGQAPEVSERERRDLKVSDLDAFFDVCDSLSVAVTEAFGKLDDLSCVDIDMEQEGEG